MIRVLATVVWPFATLDRYLTDRRIRAAQLEHARDMALTAALAHGEYFRTALADDMGRGLHRRPRVPLAHQRRRP